MKISDCKIRRVHLPLLCPYTIAFRRIEAIDILVIELKTDKGLYGIGAASPEWYVTGETITDCQMALASSPEWLMGRDVRQLPALCRGLAQRMPTTPAARAALDMAMYDLFAKQLALPLVDLLGRAHSALPTSITIGIKSLDETLREAKERIAQGFQILKIKLGHHLEEDLAKLHHLREQHGYAIQLRVDPNQGYSLDELVRFIQCTTPLQLEFIEQPLPVEQLARLKILSDVERRRIALDENLLTEKDALQLASPSPTCGIFNIKLMKCGGIYSALRIATIADIANIDLMWGCMDESVISISAALHAALASPATRYLDLDGSLDLAQDVAEGGFILERGYLRTVDEPGLGIRIGM